MEVYWLEQSEADVPAENDWLSANEAARLNAMRFAKRRADWRLGRWTAKRALSNFLGRPAHPRVLKEMEIRSALSGSPEVYFGNQPAAVAISLSHRAGVAACAVTMLGMELGCDLEMVEPHSDAFLADYFTTEEQSLVADAAGVERWRLLALLWSAKESALKALHQGLRLDSRNVIVSLSDAVFDFPDWGPMQVRHIDGRIFYGWWQHADNIVRTLVALPPPTPPIRFRVPEYVLEAASLCT